MKEKIRTFRDLHIWQLSREITNDVYRLTRKPSFRRDFRLVNQMRDSAVSIQSNIGEGFERDGNQEFRQFLSISKGSCGELETQLVVAMDQLYIGEDDEATLTAKIRRLSRMIAKLMLRLKESGFRGRKFK
jgi:four helix bundle protein